MSDYFISNTFRQTVAPVLYIVSYWNKVKNIKHISLSRTLVLNSCKDCADSENVYSLTVHLQIILNLLGFHVLFYAHCIITSTKLGHDWRVNRKALSSVSTHHLYVPALKMLWCRWSRWNKAATSPANSNNA